MYYALTQQYVGVRKELAMQNNKWRNLKLLVLHESTPFHS
jgi:hypothetical protein